MNLDDLAGRLRAAYQGATFPGPTTYREVADTISDGWCAAAEAAADALGVALDSEADPRYEAALKTLGDKHGVGIESWHDAIASAIVAALDAADADRRTA